MTTKKLLPLIFGALAILCLCLAGCATSNPDKSAGAPPFIVPPILNAASNTVATITQAVSPINPFAGLTSQGLNFGFGLAALIAAAIAKKKNDAAATQAAAADSLAATITKASLGNQAIADAGNTPHLATVAAHVANNT